MSDIVQRLRDSATQARALDRSELLNEAATLIELMRLNELMNLRDKFAMAALTGLIARDAIVDVPQRAFVIADAMLDAREGD